MQEMAARPQLPERTPRAKGEPTALDGLLVVDFTRVVAGPACTQTLADFGAEVIKIENPDGGDDTRHYEHAEIGGESAAFLSLNRNKHGIALDFTNPAALEVARELIAKADVVVENFSGGVMKKFSLDYASVAPTNPKLIYCSISAYGRKGEFALRPGFDPITQAESGFMSLNGFPDGEPVRTGPPIVDLATGMSACNAILLALIARDRLGRGQQVEVALIDTAVAMTGFYGMAYLVSGANPGRFGNSPNGSPTVWRLSGLPTTASRRWTCSIGRTSSPIPSSPTGKTGPPTRKSCAPSSPVSSPATASSTGWRR
jgi:crotonobetainyl-CoA:carnitine CoA-transferase CaiB-like acyl-CoA transferase